MFRGLSERLASLFDLYVAVSMVALLAAALVSGFAAEAPMIALLLFLLTARWILARFQRWSPIDRFEFWRRRAARALEEVGVPPLIFVLSGAAVLSTDYAGAWGVAMRAVGLFGCLGLLASALIRVHDEPGRREVHNSLLPSGHMAPLLYLLLMSLLAASFFGAALSWAAELGWVRLNPSEPNPVEAGTFFVWHLMRSIPVLEIPESFGWESPLQYENAPVVGLLVMSYKLAVLVPVVAYARYYWTHRSDPSPSSASA